MIVPNEWKLEKGYDQIFSKINKGYKIFQNTDRK